MWLSRFTFPGIGLLRLSAPFVTHLLLHSSSLPPFPHLSPSFLPVFDFFLCFLTLHIPSLRTLHFLVPDFGHQLLGSPFGFFPLVISCNSPATSGVLLKMGEGGLPPSAQAGAQNVCPGPRTSLRPRDSLSPPRPSLGTPPPPTPSPQPSAPSSEAPESLAECTRQGARSLAIHSPAARRQGSLPHTKRPSCPRLRPALLSPWPGMPTTGGVRRH